MKKGSILISLFACFLIILTACTSQTESTDTDTVPMRSYQSENGEVQVPKNPKRVAVLFHTYTGNLLKLGITPVAVNEWAKENPIYQSHLTKTEVVTENNPEKLVSVKPDLIITHSDDKNIDKYKKIAPTVVLTYTKYNYLEQHMEIGKIVGKEKEASDWVNEWKQKAEAEKKKVQAVIGTDKTVTVLESFGKEIYAYGDNWGRGTEVIYQALGLKPPQSVEKDVFGPGFKAISTEVLAKYAGDYLFVGEGSKETNNSFMETEVWKKIPAVEQKQVIMFNSDEFMLNDPLSLEKQITYIVQQLTKK